MRRGQDFLQCMQDDKIFDLAVVLLMRQGAKECFGDLQEDPAFFVETSFLRDIDQPFCALDDIALLGFSKFLDLPFRVLVSASEEQEAFVRSVKSRDMRDNGNSLLIFGGRGHYSSCLRS
eukprot:COSAG01_NODE_7_length_54400_cov_1218.054935_4_plen_120_part_00